MKYHWGWGGIREDYHGIGQGAVFKLSAGSLGALLLCFVTSINYLYFLYVYYIIYIFKS